MKNSHFLTSEELEARWQIKSFDLGDFVRQGRFKYVSRYGLKINNDKYHTMENDSLKHILFCLEEVEAFEEQHPEFKPQESSDINHPDTPPLHRKKQ